MPDSRPADYYISCLEGPVFIDFNQAVNGSIYLKRISFDGYRCCTVTDHVSPMDEADARAFKKLTHTQSADQELTERIIKKTLAANRNILWKDALTEYGLR